MQLVYSTLIHSYIYVAQDPLQVLCGKSATSSHLLVKLPSEKAVAQFYQLNACAPVDAGKFALRLLSLFYTNEELAESNCMPAEGRKLIQSTLRPPEVNMFYRNIRICIAYMGVDHVRTSCLVTKRNGSVFNTVTLTASLSTRQLWYH